MVWLALFFAIPAVLTAVAVHRVLRVARRFRDPEALRELLSADVRVALDRAGVGLDADGMLRLRESDELTRRVVADLRRAFVRAVLRPSSGAPTRTVAPVTGSPSEALLEATAAPRRSDRAAVPGLPTPIDALPSPTTRAAVCAAVGLGLASAAIWLFGRG